MAMDLRQLRCFEAVLLTGAMTRAAELLNLAQPTVSVTIAQLEREVGFTLFKRSKGWLEPTPEAYSLHKAAKPALEAVSRVGDTAREIRRLTEGNISILCYPGLSWKLMPEMIAEFLADHPGVEVKLISRSSWALRHLLAGQDFDLAIVETPVPHARSNMAVFRYPCMCVVPLESALSQKTTISPQDLDGFPLVTLFPDHITNHQVRAAFADSGSALNLALECDYFASAFAFVANGGGAAIIDPVTLHQFETGAVAVRPFNPEIMYEIALLGPNERVQSKLSEAFEGVIRNRLSRMCTTYEPSAGTPT